VIDEAESPKMVDGSLSCLTVLTASEPNIEVMRGFLESLETFSQQSGVTILWRVVDGLKAFPSSFNCSVFNAELVHIDWICPGRALSHAEAIMHGFALSREGYVLMMSPDMSLNVADIPAFIDEIRGGATAVAGWRVKRNGISCIRRLLTKVFNGFVRALFKLKINDINTCMALVSPKVVDFLLDAPSGCPSPALYTAILLRDEISQVPINVPEHPAKESTYSIGGRAKVGMERLREVVSFLFWMESGRND